MARTMQTSRRSSPELGNVAQADADPQPGTGRAQRHGKVDKKKYKKSDASRKKLSEALTKIKTLEEQLACERSWHRRYHDALDEAGLICGVCLEEPVLQANLKCCSSRLCTKCEEQVAEKHEACPFCRAFLTTPAQQERKRQQQQQQQQQASSRATNRRSPRESSHDSRSDDDSYSDDYSQDYSSDDYGSGQPGMDTTVLLAAAAEAAVAAHAGPKDDCGLCGTTWIKSSMGQSEALPGMLICRSCWRNVPELSQQRFPPDEAAAAAAMGAGSLQFGGTMGHGDGGAMGNFFAAVAAAARARAGAAAAAAAPAPLSAAAAAAGPSSAPAGPSTAAAAGQQPSRKRKQTSDSSTDAQQGGRAAAKKSKSRAGRASSPAAAAAAAGGGAAGAASKKSKSKAAKGSGSSSSSGKKVGKQVGSSKACVKGNSSKAGSSSAAAAAAQAKASSRPQGKQGSTSRAARRAA